MVVCICVLRLVVLGCYLLGYLLEFCCILYYCFMFGLFGVAWLTLIGGWFTLFVCLRWLLVLLVVCILWKPCYQLVDFGF